MIGPRTEVSRVFGRHVVAKLIKQKKYRKDLTDFVDSLRLSKNFRDRQMYLTIAKAAFEEDQEIYKKHFAKAICNEMAEEKVTVVKMLIAKLANAVPHGYSKSTDKIAETIKAQGNSEVNQFFDADNEAIQSRRFLDPASISVKLKVDEEEDEELEGSKREESKLSSSKGTQAEEGKDLSRGEQEEQKEIAAVEKSVQIRLCNYSMLVRAQQFSSGLSAQLMALLGGYGSLLLGGSSDGKAKMLDEDEEKMLQAKKKADEEEEAKRKAAEEDEEDDEDTW